jgi:hypothetical protein
MLAAAEKYVASDAVIEAQIAWEGIQVRACARARIQVERRA